MEETLRTPRERCSTPPWRVGHSGATTATPEHPHEADRLESLYSYQILDTPSDPHYDDIVALAASVLDVPVAVMSLVDSDRQWFKASVGLDYRETPRNNALCAWVVATGQPVVISDAYADGRLAQFVMVRKGLRSYAGVPLISRDGLPLGALGVLDTRPREFDERTLRVLETVAERIVAQMDLDRLDRQLGAVSDELGDPMRSGPVLRGALDRGEFRAYFQPMVDVATGRRCGMEALARWVTPHGMIPPDEFMPTLESTGLVAPFGRHIARQALRGLAECQLSGRFPPDFGVAVNASPLQLSQPGFATDLLDAIGGCGVQPQHVTVELTESRTVAPIDSIADQLTTLRQAGLRVDADDFGSGYSTLQRLLDLPLTGLKLDMDIVRRIPDDPRTTRVVGSIIAIAHDLGLSVVGEGVESVAQRDCLGELGCDKIQGFLVGRPAPIRQLLRDQAERHP